MFWRASCFGLLLLLSAAGSCASEEPEFNGAIDYLSWISGPFYSAFDGVHSYAVTPQILSVAHPENDSDPVIAASLRWDVDERFVARSEHPELPGSIKLTTKKAGKTRIDVSLQTVSGTTGHDFVELTIAQGNPRDWELGDERYRSGEPVSWTDPTALEPTAAPGEGTCGLPTTLEYPKSAACVGCHDGRDAMSEVTTPTQTASYSDEELIEIITNGAKPAGATFYTPYLRATPMPDCIFKAFHTWEVSGTSWRGIVLKLRSLPPSGREHLSP